MNPDPHEPRGVIRGGPNRGNRPTPAHELGWALPYPTWALSLAFVLGFSPIGGDILYTAFSAKMPVIYASISGLFVLAILTPITLLYQKGGIRGLFGAPFRIGFTVCIIVFRLVVDTQVILQMIR